MNAVDGKEIPVVTLRVPTFDETVAIDNYKAASAAALTTADSFADKVVTAAFTLATAYAAAIALVQTSGDPAPATVLVPLVPLVLAVALGLVSQSMAIKIDATNNAVTVQERVSGTVNIKRIFSVLAVISLVIGVGLATFALYEVYGPGAEDKSPTEVKLFLTPVGAKLVERTCGTAAETLPGTVKDDSALTAKQVSIAVPAASCGDQKATLVLPRAAIAAAKH